VYPPSGEQILGVSANAAFVVPANTRLSFKKLTNTVWASTSPAAIMDVGNGVSTRQNVEGTGIKLWEHYPFTSGFAPFDIHSNSFANSGGGAGTYNHAVHMGWNASRHSATGTATSNKPSVIMGFEDNYYDNGGDNVFGPEWYIEYYSPDGTSIQQRRPFYARFDSTNNSTDTVTVKSEIGTSGSGQFIIKTDSTHTVLQIAPGNASTQVAYLKLQSNSTGSGPTIGALGETNTPMLLSSSGTGRIDFLSGFFGQVNFRIVGSGGSGKFVQVTSSASNPTIDASSGLLTIGGTSVTINIASGGSTTISTGVGSVRMSTVNAATNAAWIPLAYAGVTYYVPAWTTNAP